jgi:hypothetical protein
MTLRRSLSGHYNYYGSGVMDYADGSGMQGFNFYTTYKYSTTENVTQLVFKLADGSNFPIGTRVAVYRPGF